MQLLIISSLKSLSRYVSYHEGKYRDMYRIVRWVYRCSSSPSYIYIYIYMMSYDLYLYINRTFLVYGWCIMWPHSPYLHIDLYENPKSCTLTRSCWLSFELKVRQGREIDRCYMADYKILDKPISFCYFDDKTSAKILVFRYMTLIIIKKIFNFKLQFVNFSVLSQFNFRFQWTAVRFSTLIRVVSLKFRTEKNNYCSNCSNF